MSIGVVVIENSTFDIFLKVRCGDLRLVDATAGSRSIPAGWLAAMAGWLQQRDGPLQ